MHSSAVFSSTTSGMDLDLRVRSFSKMDRSIGVCGLRFIHFLYNRSNCNFLCAHDYLPSLSFLLLLADRVMPTGIFIKEISLLLYLSLKGMNHLQFLSNEL